MAPISARATATADAWYLIYTRPRQEMIALENIQRQGYGAFLPLLRSRKRRHGRLKDVVEPMFPRYLFVQLNTTTDNWRPIQSTFGVSALVRFGMEPARVPSDLVSFVQAQADEGGIRDLIRPRRAVGDRVRIGTGLLKGFEGIVLARSGRERVVLLLEAASAARIEVAEDDIDGA